jgi:hypothetical protein
MTEEPLVRDIWKTFERRSVVGERMTRTVGARAWERPFFARFKRFFERCGLPDPWDPNATQGDIALGEVGIAQRKTVAPHAAPPSTGPKGPNLPNLPKAAAAPTESKAPVDGKPAPRIGEIRRDDTAELKRKLAETEKKKVDPARANLFKVNQPVARLPMRPELASGEGAPPKPGAKPASTPTKPPLRPTTPARPGGARPAGPGSSAPRMSAAPTRTALRDGPEEVVDKPPARATNVGAFGMGGDWDDEPIRPHRPVEEVQAPEIAAPPAPPSPAPGGAPRRPPPMDAMPAPSSAPTPSVAPVRPPPPRPPPMDPLSDERPAVRPAAPKPGQPPPRPGKPGGGMDDLFGMGGENTRVKMPKKEEVDANKPRRPMVTSEEDLKKLGIDRRPPPPKPPQVTASPGARGADPEDDGGE